MRNRMDRFIYRTNMWLSASIKMIIIVLVAAVVCWIGVSVYANIKKEQTPKAQVIPTFPAIEQAHWIFIVRATGQTILSNHKTDVSKGNYLLHGYYEMVDKSWIYHKGDLPLNEKYFGTIKVVQR